MLKKHKDSLVYVYAIIIGMLIFIAVYGIKVLNPLYTDWLFGKAKDLSQHYLGWEFYRKGDWTFPFGLTNQIAYPTYTSVIFTDSIPLFAVFFKLISPLLPGDFQYFGWWGILCFALQGFFAAKILRELNVGRVQTLLGCILFILSPTVIEKMFRHTALGGHWIILLSIYLFVLHNKNYKNILKTSLQWGIIGILIASIHLYYLPMCGIFAIAYVLCSFFKERKIDIKFALPFILFMIGIVINTYLLGGFSSKADLGSDGLGEYSFNLNGFFNPKGYSRFFESLNTYKDGQYEGFAYLGLGIFILLFISVFYFFINIKKKEENIDKEKLFYILMYICISIGLILFSASPQVSFNDKLLFEFPDIDIIIKYWSVFRASGRMVWPVCYLIYICVIVCNDRLWKNINLNKTIPIILLAICVILQVTDLSAKLKGQRKAFAKEVTYTSPLQEEIWYEIPKIEEVSHIVCTSNNFSADDYLTLAKYAHDNDFTINNFYFARGIDVRENIKYSLEHLDNKSIYLFYIDEKETALNYGLYLYETDKFIVGTTFKVM